MAAGRHASRATVLKFARAARPAASGRGRALGTVELAPLIDVVFLLLIFFMVSTTFVQRSQLQVDLPVADVAVGGWQAADVEVRVSAQGRYTVDERPLSADDAGTLKDALGAARADDSRVVIVADALASHQAVVRVMAVAGELGLRDVRIVTKRPNNGEEAP